MSERLPVVVVGAGPAGLAVSYELQRAGVEHVVLERGRLGQSWRDRWDSFCLVTPNWYVRLPGGAYDGNDPDGFMPRDDIVAYLEHYAAGFKTPIREAISVGAVRSADEGSFLLETSDGDILADAIVLSTGSYQKPHRPPGARTLPSDVLAIDAEQYTNPNDLPAGSVLVVGSGQTGCQLAEEMNEAGRRVVLACGKAPWAPRRLDGRDIVSWLVETPFLEHTPDVLPTPLARLGANFQVSGHARGRDLNFRTLQNAGVTLAGRFLDANNHHVRLADDLHESVAFGDTRYGDISNLIRTSCNERGERAPDLPPPAPFVAEPPDEFDLRECGAVIFTAGFRPDYAKWVHFPGAFDDLGFPMQRDGASTIVEGMYFAGMHFMRKRKSATLYGFGEDAAIVAEGISERLR